MQPLSGFIYIDFNFPVTNKKNKPKYIVVLCDSSIGENEVLIAITTSRETCPESYGCYFNQRPPCFYIPCDYLPKRFADGTTILLDNVFAFETDKLSKWTRVGELTVEHTAALLSCGAGSEFISGYDRDAMLQQALLLSGK